MYTHPTHPGNGKNRNDLNSGMVPGTPLLLMGDCVSMDAATRQRSTPRTRICKESSLFFSLSFHSCAHFHLLRPSLSPWVASGAGALTPLCRISLSFHSNCFSTRTKCCPPSRLHNVASQLDVVHCASPPSLEFLAGSGFLFFYAFSFGRSVLIYIDATSEKR
jgi:hypothetical protein